MSARIILDTRVPSEDSYRACEAELPQQGWDWYCTLRTGHDGPHVGTTHAPVRIIAWEDKEDDL